MNHIVFDNRMRTVYFLLGLIAWANGVAMAPGGRSAARAQRVDQRQVIAFTLELPDPVDPAGPPRAYRVRQFRDAHGFPAGYAMSIWSHVCADGKCKPLAVTMYWNALGDYQRIEHPPDQPLTKKEHVPFDAEDYAKLDSILKDPHSLLRSHSMAFLAQPSEDGQGGVDAWSGATPLTVQQSVVKDAAYTTWVLWQWAQGPIVSRLRGMTQRECTPAYLKHLLGSEAPGHAEFALAYILEHDASNPDFVDDVFGVLQTGDRQRVALALRILDQAVTDKKALHARLIQACWRMRSTYRPMVLDHLSSQPQLAPETMEALTERLDRLPYFEVHLILRLLENRGYFSAATEANVVRLLDGENFFVARRAYEHLRKYEPSGPTRRKLDAFGEQYRDRL